MYARPDQRKPSELSGHLNPSRSNGLLLVGCVGEHPCGQRGASIAASIGGHVLDVDKQLEHGQPANVSVTHSGENQMRSWQGTLYRKQVYLEALYSEMLYSEALFLEYYFRSTKFGALNSEQGDL